jgi:predicted enzyme related to lactoylglutathione lyase
MALITGVDFVHVPTQNFDESVRFFQEVLGLEKSVTYGRHPGAEFETGNLTLQVMDQKFFGREFTPNTQPIAFHVEDIKAAKAELESRGVKFIADGIDSGVCNMEFFSDPDGNSYMLHHRYAPKSPQG